MYRKHDRDRENDLYRWLKEIVDKALAERGIPCNLIVEQGMMTSLDNG